MASAKNESGPNQKRWDIPNVYTVMWWYASFPNHYAGEADKATRELEQLVTEHYIDSFVTALIAIRAEISTLHLQN